MKRVVLTAVAALSVLGACTQASTVAAPPTVGQVQAALADLAAAEAAAQAAGLLSVNDAAKVDAVIRATQATLIAAGQPNVITIAPAVLDDIAAAKALIPR